MRILLKQKISNLKDEGFEDIERTVNITQAHIDGDTYNQFYLNYFISYTKNGVDVSHLFEKKSHYDWYINNNESIMVRNEKFEPVLDESGSPIRMPAFNYVWSIFEAMDAISFEVLRMYILENDSDGKFDIKPLA